MAEVARQLRGGDPDAADTQQITSLQKSLEEEKVRAAIAGYASVSAIQNATKEAAERKSAEAALAKVQPELDAAHTSLARAQKRVEDLEAQLAVTQQEVKSAQSQAATSQLPGESASTQIMAAQAAEAKAKAQLQDVEAREAQEKKAAQAAESAAKTSRQQEDSLKVAAAAATRSGHPQASMSDLALIGFLRDCPCQPVLGLVFGIAGLYSVVNGPYFFQGFFIISFAAAAGTCVCAESLAFAGDLGGIVGNSVVGVEAALVTAAACYYGLDGFQIVAGGMLGLVFAYVTCGLFIPDTPENKLSEVTFYTIAVLLGALSMAFGDRHAHAVVGPLTGGLLFASFVVYMAAFLMASQAAASAKFLDFVEGLLTGGGAMSVFGQQEATVWLCGASLWMVVFLIGISRHFCGWFGGDDESEYRRPSRKRSSRSDRTDPLLPSARSGRSGSPRGYDDEPSGRSSSRSSKQGNSRREQYNMYGKVG